MKDRLAQLAAQVERPDLWDDQPKAQKLLREQASLNQSLEAYEALPQELADYIELLDMARAEGDAESEQEATSAIEELARRARDMKTRALFSGEADGNDCFMEIHSGAGGTESCDWAAMLLRMYLRWANKHGFKTEVIDELAGDEAGIKSATIRISGHQAYGWAKTESGVHRLVRISPFDSANRRHTSFASVWVYPQIDDNIEIEIDEKDVRVDTYRASGAGGQHVNKTDSAIRLTHEPTGIVVQCQNDRSQHRNRAEAWNMLRARLYELELRRQEEQAHEQQAQKTDNSWGNQIRSYVLHPYQMVKDLRTRVETGNTDAVLDGDLDDFISASLAARVGSKE